MAIHRCQWWFSETMVFQETFMLLSDFVAMIVLNKDTLKSLNSSLQVYNCITVPCGLKMTQQN